MKLVTYKVVLETDSKDVFHLHHLRHVLLDLDLVSIIDKAVENAVRSREALDGVMVTVEE